MSDNLFPESVVTPSSSKLAFAETTFGGDTVFVGASFLGVITGAEGSRTFTPVTSTAPLPVMGYGQYNQNPAILSDGDYSNLQLSDEGAMRVSIVDSLTSLPVSDGGSSLTVDGTVAFSNTTIAVTNVGTFAVQAAQSGTWNIGTVTTLTGITNVVHVDDNAGSLTVDYATTGSGNATGALRVELANNGTGVIATVGAVTAITNALPAGTNAIGKLAANSGVTIGAVEIAAAQTLATVTTVSTLTSITNWGNIVDDAAFTPGTTRVSMSGFQADETATDSVDEGDGGAARMTLDRKQIVTVQPHTAGGLSVFRSLDLDETEEDVKTSAGCLYKLRITNFATTTRYVKLYNATAANTTVGSTTPIDTIPIPPASASSCIVLTESYGGVGLTFDTALCIAATTALADADTGAPGANDVVVTAYYK